MSTTDYEATPNAAITSDHTGGSLDFIRTAIMSLQHFAEQTSDDQELAAVHKRSCSSSWPVTRRTVRARSG